jgi:ABC-type oligopeptide transport system substrate-binding subunit
MALALLLTPALAYAEHTYALAMHGTPKYPSDFKNMDYVNPQAPKGGALKTSKNGSFNNLNNHVVLGNNAEGLELINDKLMQRAWNEPFTLYGLAAESIDIAPDRSWIVFHLNKKARFHDGQAMTSADVKFSYEMYRKFGHPVRRRVYGLVKDVKILNKQDIKFTFGERFDRESVMILGLMPVLPKQYWEKRDISKTTLEPPLGSGPYKIKSLETGRKITYERVKDYWAKDLPINVGLYNFDTITYSYYRDDDIALEAFKAGDYNLRREYNVHKWKTAYDFKDLSSGAVVKAEIAHQRPEWLRAFIFNTRRPLFQDRRVREALNLMFNFDWINQNLFFGMFKRVTSIFPNSELAADNASFVTAGKDMRDNQRRAMALLKQAGWEYQGGVLTNAATHEKFSFEILLNDPADEKVALEFSRALKKIGIEIRVRTVDSAQFTGRLDAYDYDVVDYRWINSLSPGNEQMNYWGSDAAQTKGARNYAGIESKAIDALADSIARAPDRASLVARAKELDRAVMAGYYFVPLYYLGRDMAAYAIQLKHPDVNPIYGMTVESWWYQE